MSRILTDVQVEGELYSAWLRDTREKPPPSKKMFSELLDRTVSEREINMAKERIGPNLMTALLSALPRSQLTKIDAYLNRLGDAGCEAVAHYLREDKTLIYLNLGGNDISSTGAMALAGTIGQHPKLHTLILGSAPGDSQINTIDNAAARALVEKCRQIKTLRVLDFSRNPLGATGQECFASLQQLVFASPLLQVLKLSQTGMTSESAMQLLQGVAKSGSLHTLDLSHNDLSSAVAASLGRLVMERSSRSTPSPLRIIVLSGNPRLGDAGCAELFRALGTDKGVQTLCVDGCGVTDMSLVVLCDALVTNATLVRLDLHGNAITDVGAVRLASSLLAHTSMAQLSLAHNRIKDDGACAVASLMEASESLTHVDLEDGWVSDRGAIALGVALSGNTSVTTLRLHNNHISEDGGTAFVALLEKNRHVQHCTLRGNNIFHSTVMHAQRVCERNQKLKQDAVPNDLRKEVIKLHYQMYKLEEAKSELAVQQSERMKIDKAVEEFEMKFRHEEAEYRKKLKEISDQLLACEAQAKSSEKELNGIVEGFKKYEQNHENEMVQLRERYDAEVKERERAEEELRRVQAEVEHAESLRGQRVTELRQRIDAAKEDRERWVEQTRTYRRQLDELQTKVKELESKQPEKKKKDDA